MIIWTDEEKALDKMIKIQSEVGAAHPWHEKGIYEKGTVTFLMVKGWLSI